MNIQTLKSVRVVQDAGVHYTNNNASLRMHVRIASPMGANGFRGVFGLIMLDGVKLRLWDLR